MDFPFMEYNPRGPESGWFQATFPIFFCPILTFGLVLGQFGQDYF